MHTGLIKELGGERLKIGQRFSFSRDLTGRDGDFSEDHLAAIAGWKSRKEQLHKQQESVMKVNDEAEKVDLVAMSKKKD